MNSDVRILYASQRPPYPFFLGGAARCAHRVLVSLAQDLGMECMAVGSADYAATPWTFPQPHEFETLQVRGAKSDAITGLPISKGGELDCAYPVRVLPELGRALPRLIDEFKPDVVWSQLEGAHEVLACASNMGIPGLLFVHDAEDEPRELRAIAALGCHVVCSSGFLAHKVSQAIGRPAQVVYPASEWHFGTTSDPQGYVTMINPHAVKGLDTFLEVARRTPSQRFLLQESWKLGDSALAELQARLIMVPNVRFEHRVADMRQVYAQTRLLVVPSVWEEGFGMVAVEAQSCGIPVIASARGGLPESVGDGGLLVDDYRNPDAWVAAIESVLGSTQAYRTWSGKALAHARSPDFDPQETARRFLAVCQAPLPRAGPVARGLHSLGQRLRRLPGMKR